MFIKSLEATVEDYNNSGREKLYYKYVGKSFILCIVRNLMRRVYEKVFQTRPFLLCKHLGACRHYFFTLYFSLETHYSNIFLLHSCLFSHPASFPFTYKKYNKGQGIPHKYKKVRK